ncbi:MAG: sigma-70 family RNA polymerase sigma factor [Syntrophomonadaceae bacterium]|nr:sigma-70 family RNA polymerase sigma factor [Syntrophomonadaceae bacterium]
MYTDEQLIKKCLADEVSAFDELVERYQNKIYTLCYRYMGNEEDAQDVAQETFLKAYRSLRSFRGQSSFGTWLYRICNTVCLDELRKRKRRVVALPLDNAPEEERDRGSVREIADDSLSGDKVYEQKELEQYIQTMLNEMRVEYRNAIVLRDVMGFSYEEIAAMLDCSLGTVKSRINRGRQTLKNKMEERELFP